MTKKQFKPMLAPNEAPDLTKIKYPILASTKLDGIRCIFKNGRMLSRQLKDIPNKQLQNIFKPLKDLTLKTDIILDGELYAHGIGFQRITHFVMTEDLEDIKTINDIKRKIKSGEITGGLNDWCKIPEKLMFYCFDSISKENYDEPFINRIIFNTNFNKMYCVEQHEIANNHEVNRLFEKVLKENYEGLILRNIHGKYKCGRGTIKEGLIYKVKPYRTFDGEIISVNERQENTTESKINELGYKEKSKNKNNLKSTGLAANFVVKYKDTTVKVTITGSEDFRRYIWNNRDKYIGQICEYKGMLVGAKDKPRHPIFLRFREDKSDISITRTSI